VAIWVNLNRAAKFPEIQRVYKRAGWGQGTGQVPGQGQPQNVGLPSSAAKGFLTYVKYLVQGAANGTIVMPSWIQLSPGAASNDWQNCKVNVSAIPGVRPLYANGKYQNSSVYNP
jgi:hypothetical protein